MARRLGILFALLVTIVTSSGLSAQTFASIAGTVADPSGAMLPGATLVLTNTQAGAKYEIQSARTGSFEFVGLPQGDYTLDVRLAGFRALQQRIAVGGRNVSLALSLQLGELTETLHVTAQRGNAQALTPRATDPAAIENARQRFQQVLAQCTTAGAGVGTRVGGSIRPPRRINSVNPQYPSALAEAGIGGTVRLDAIIGPDGYIRDVSNADPSTHPGLVDAAIDAVQEWQFDGTLLNCVPVPVVMHVLVQFEVR